MKVSLIVFGIIAIVGVFFSFWFLLSSNPLETKDTPPPVTTFPDVPTISGEQTQPLPNQRATAGTQPFIAESLRKQMTNTGSVTMGGTIVVSTYAVQMWGDENTGGEALLKYNADGSWGVVSQGGGMISVASLVSVGVPEQVAIELVAGRN